ncbi:MAG: branched-chain amino acid ABC transporter permease [Firmicutes bacterium]|nr:branched-chain amino acid ABC transporter permease [Bacillota bacterium]
MTPQVLVNGILLGGIYAAVGAGFSLVWGVLNIINIAHGASVMLGAYVTFFLFSRFGLDPFLTIPISMLTLFVVGYVMQRALINRVIAHGVFMTLVLTFGLSLFLIDMALLAFSADYRSVTPAYAGSGLSFGGLVVPYQRLAILAIALTLIAVLNVFLSTTRMGRAIRATVLNRQAAQLCGVDIHQIYAVTFGLGAALAGAAGSMLAMVVTISPFMGNTFIGKSFVIATLGGLGTVQGALVGGLLLGLAESLGAAVLGPSYQQALGFALLLLVLVLRPEGLLGKKFFAEVK